MSHIISMLGLRNAIRWSLRGNTRDVVEMYESLSPLMCRITGSRMLNFGYWDEDHGTPALAQQNMCNVVADFADLKSVDKSRAGSAPVLDVGSGLGGPAEYWMKKMCGRLDILCMNTSHLQLRGLECHTPALHYNAGGMGDKTPNAAHACQRRAGFLCAINASATILPLADSSVDRIISLESAQHFEPLAGFAAECVRVMSDSALLTIAIPVVTRRLAFARLGILNVTWASAHPSLEYVHKVLRGSGLEVCQERLIGDFVYGPLADYYAENRDTIRTHARAMAYPKSLEGIIAASMKCMKNASAKGVIDYALMQCRRRNAVS